MPLTNAQIERFRRDGAVALRGAFDRSLADECRALLWRETGCDERDPSTWTTPVIRIAGRSDPPFRAAANTVGLTAAYDQLAGRGRWVPREGLGTFPIRFPHPDDPGDDGWHIEATGADGAGKSIVDPASTERVLLLLFLFSDVGPDDAPTRVRIGTHLDAARLLHRHGGPIGSVDAARELKAATVDAPEVAATGAAGDVWLCHPYVVHAAQAHHGTAPKFMAQPPLAGTAPIDPWRPVGERSVVEAAIHDAVAGTDQSGMSETGGYLPVSLNLV